jgi:hypothetical protein
LHKKLAGIIVIKHTNFGFVAKIQLRPSSGEFEMAYQARVAIDRIRFAIKATEAARERPDDLREAGMQLLDALDRLEAAERRFQNRWRCPGSPAKWPRGCRS